jgi:lantibiotic transport system ATP-binding protein
MPDYAIRTQGLTFTYAKNRKALDNVSLHIPKGAIYGFLGPNGAGKSTTMRLLTGILPEQENAIEIFGKPLQSQLPEVFANIGSLVESPALYLHLSGYNNMKYIATLRGIPLEKIGPALEMVELTADANRKVKQYSLGMKQRLAIAMALLSEPQLLLLDEPVNGLDPNGMRDIRQLLVKLNKEKGVTIFVSSHLLAEIERMCTHVGIISNGKLRFEGTIQQLAGQSGACRIRVSLTDPAQWADRLKVNYPALGFDGNQIVLELPGRDSIPAFTKELVTLGADVYEIKILNGLEEWFMALINQQ